LGINGNVLYLDCDGGYIILCVCVCVCINTSKNTVKIGKLYHNKMDHSQALGTCL
jgi:hypothetical protein